MTSSPATPHKPVVSSPIGSSKTSKMSIEQFVLSSNSKQSSRLEPSPATTYGDTAAGGSSPATPKDHFGNDSYPSRYHYSGYPVDATGDGAVTDQLNPSGFKTKDKGPANAEVAECSPSKHRKVSCASPSAHRGSKIQGTSSWRADGDFILVDHPTDDPFMTSGHAQLASTQPGAYFPPRPDRLGQALSSDTAQAVLLPAFCVFVANLASGRSDEELEYSVGLAFGQFGDVFVKIRRDPKGMPYAFCQFKNLDECMRAIDQGRGIMINGRPCRTEKARVNRSLYLYRLLGGRVTEIQALELLGKFGSIEKLWYCSATDKEMFRLPEGIWVKFAYFEDCREAQKAFRDHRLYRLEQPVLPEEARALIRRSPARNFPRRDIEREAADSRTIFVGNLPHGANETKLSEFFGTFGRILGVVMIPKPSKQSSAFAFIEYEDEEIAKQAVSSSDHKLDGVELRVERKEPAGRRMGGAVGSPSLRNRNLSSLIDRNVTLGMLYAQALNYGLDLPTASRILNIGNSLPPYVPSDQYCSQYAHGFIAGPSTGHSSPGMLGNSQAMLHQPMGQFQYQQAPITYQSYPDVFYPPSNYGYSQSDAQ